MTTTTADKGELLPCPFCGGTVKLECDNPLDLRWLWVGCKTCGISTTKSAYDYRVINAWNRRPNEGQDGLTEEVFDRCITEANRSYTRHKNSIRGQIVTPDDDWNWHFAHAIARHLSRKQSK